MVASRVQAWTSTPDQLLRLLNTLVNANVAGRMVFDNLQWAAKVGLVKINDARVNYLMNFFWFLGILTSLIRNVVKLYRLREAERRAKALAVGIVAMAFARFPAGLLTCPAIRRAGWRLPRPQAASGTPCLSRRRGWCGLVLPALLSVHLIHTLALAPKGISWTCPCRRLRWGGQRP